MDKNEIQNRYYTTDIDASVDGLINLQNIATNFANRGEDILPIALTECGLDIDEVIKQTKYVSNARNKIEEELLKMQRLRKTFNKTYATGHNNYFSSAAHLIDKIRKHTATYKSVLKTFCSKKHPMLKECRKHHITVKSVWDESLLRGDLYARPLFGLDSYPYEVQTLYNELVKFFLCQSQCMQICIEILNEEAEIKKDPEKCKYLLDKYTRKALKKMKTTIYLFFSEATAENLKEVNLAYKALLNYSSELDFAQGEFHKHNEDDMDHYCIIKHYEKISKLNITPTESKMWDNDSEKVLKVRCAINSFDDLLPANFNQKKMGEYTYYFAQWANPANIKKAVNYFLDNYKGHYRTVGYSAVISHSSEYDKNSPEVEQFSSAINREWNNYKKKNDLDIAN